MKRRRLILARLEQRRCALEFRKRRTLAHRRAQGLVGAGGELADGIADITRATKASGRATFMTTLLVAASRAFRRRQARGGA